VTVPPPASDQPSLPLGFTFVDVNVAPPSCEDDTHTFCAWLKPT
jgi:hypothetical protein